MSARASILMRRRFRYFSWRQEWPAAIVIIGVLLPLYWLSMPPGVTFEDTGMVAAMCYRSGLLHPPGYPLYSMLCAPFAGLSDVLPINPARATALLSAIAAAAACVLFYEVARRFGARTIIAVIAAMTLGAGARFWSQAIIPEVYALNALLVMATLTAVLRWTRAPWRRRLYWLFFLFGLGLANHWPLYVIHAPVFALLGWRRFGRLKSPHLWAGGLIMLALGLSPYGYILLRADGGELLSLFPPPQDVNALLAYIARDVYTTTPTPTPEWAQCAANGVYALWLLAAEYSFVGALLAAAGAIMFCRSQPLNRSVAVLWGVVASAPALSMFLCEGSGTVGKTVYAAYPLPAMIFLMLLITEVFRRPPMLAANIAAAALAAGAGMMNWRENNRADDDFAEQYSTAVLSALPSGAAFLITEDLDFPLFYRHHALGERDDVVVMTNAEEFESHHGRRFDTGSRRPGGVRDWGVLQEWAAEDETFTSSPLPESLMKLYHRLLQRYSRFGETRQWDKKAVRYGIFSVSRALTSASLSRELTEEESEILSSVSQTPEGLYGRLIALLKAGKADSPEARETLSAVRAVHGSLFPEWRARLLHYEGVLDFFQGMPEKSRKKWRRALALDNAVDNPALIDLLHLMAAMEEWESYANLRRRYWMTENPALKDSDSQCAKELGSPCLSK